MRRLLVISLLAALAAGCTSTLIKAEKVVHLAIVTSEESRCTVRPAPCLSEQQFKDVNAALYRAAVAGSHATAIEATRTSEPGAYAALYSAITDAIAAMRATGIGGPIGSALSALVGAQANVQAYLQKHGVTI